MGLRSGLQISGSRTPNPDAPFRERFPDAQATIVGSMFSPTVQGGTGTGPGGNVPTADAGSTGGGTQQPPDAM
jgi:hypothetical protein